MFDAWADISDQCGHDLWQGWDYSSAEGQRGPPTALLMG